MKHLTAALAICAIAGTAAACSGGDEPRSKGGSGTSQAAAPKPVPAASLSPVSLPGQQGPLVDTISRQVRTAGTVRTEAVLNGNDGGQKSEEKISAQMRIGAGPPQAQLTIVTRDPAESGTTEAVVTGGVVYTRVDGEEQAPGKPWVRLSRQDLRDPELGPFTKILTGLLDSVDTALSQISTDSGLQLVRAGRFTGTPADDTVEGIRTRRFSGTTPTAELSGTDTAFKAIAQLGAKEVPWTLWVDEKGLPRRFHVDVKIDRGLNSAHQITFRQWGEPLIIQPPPPAKVHSIGH